ncbi:TPA: hypothetical protein PXM11_004339 [Yersinia enterocolitica]|uniref:Ead/Ea22-like family protein n=1 Tax=Yersinia enterocolitica TaxID=630 RepID=A0ABP1XYF1_YEREN|nr:hypothetical protein [Yersinia enterocolitica]AOF13995.1 hypothetical protein BB936_05405 [Yersinia enterocolitica]AOF14201.1 hypothetical protein BB936_06620 [Yersinia enterocolitica]AOF14933.1 hypothetical protein BB936_11100 [Yersinia enterocolitica]AOF18105.1 hypothetical protein BED34_05290 [Yersinia enterocolitica]AOF18319.1 hypothetical protein BED34_06540 [Yersinia enterocolitica]
MNIIEEIKKALESLKSTEYGDVWDSALVEGDSGERYNAITNSDDVVVRALDSSRHSSWLCDYLESVSPKNIAVIISRLEEAEAALSAANERLSKPVVLPPRRSASSFVDEEFSNKDLAAIYNAARIEFSVKITNAGFTVEDE